MKITIYTIKDCAFSKQEKEYLNLNKLQFEEKDLEVNKDFLTEMLTVSNNFAGTPVTKIEKDDGSIVVLKGFTKEEFDTTFGLAPAPANSQTPPAAAPATNPEPVNDTPIPPAVEPPLAGEETTPGVGAVSPASVETTTPSPGVVETPTTPDPLKSVMDNLQSKSQPTDQPITNSTSSTNSTDSSTSAVPPAADPTAPTIPDFPAK